MTSTAARGGEAAFDLSLQPAQQSIPATATTKPATQTGFWLRLRSILDIFIDAPFHFSAPFVTSYTPAAENPKTLGGTPALN
jgi:hypothetical protein